MEARGLGAGGRQKLADSGQRIVFSDLHVLPPPSPGQVRRQYCYEAWTTRSLPWPHTLEDLFCPSSSHGLSLR